MDRAIWKPYKNPSHLGTLTIEKNGWPFHYADQPFETVISFSDSVVEFTGSIFPPVVMIQRRIE